MSKETGKNAGCDAMRAMYRKSIEIADLPMNLQADFLSRQTLRVIDRSVALRGSWQYILEGTLPSRGKFRVHVAALIIIRL